MIELLKCLQSKKCIRWSLSITLFLLLVFSFCFERVPRADGAGWDGILYRDMMQNFLQQFKNGGYSEYYTQKCLPFAIINIVDTLFGIKNSFFTLVCFEFVCIALAVWAFFKISNYLSLNKKSEIIAFALLFFTHATLRIGYDPYQGDPFAYTIGMWIFYFFLTKQHWKMLGITFVGAFVWQSLVPITLLLFILPQEGYNLVDGKNVSTKYAKVLKIVKILLSILVIMIPAKMFSRAELSRGGWENYERMVPYYFWDMPIWVVFATIVTICLIVYFLLQPFSFNIKDFVLFVFKKMVWWKWLVAFVFYFVIKCFIRSIANTEISASGNENLSFIHRIFYEPFMIPLKFCASHLANEGMLICLLVLCYKEVVRYASEHSVGYVAALMMTILFGLQTESRFVLNFFPFVAFPIAKKLSEIQLKKWIPLLACSVQLFLSAFWFKQNTPTLGQALAIDNDRAYQIGEAQRCLYSNGPWMGPKAYFIFLFLFVVIMAFLYIGRKNNWYVEKDI